MPDEPMVTFSARSGPTRDRVALAEPLDSFPSLSLSVPHEPTTGRSVEETLRDGRMRAVIE